MREGGSIPVTLTFAEALGVNVLLLPMGRGDDGAQYVSAFLAQRVLLTCCSSTNEKLDISNFIEGVRNKSSSFVFDLSFWVLKLYGSPDEASRKLPLRSGRGDEGVTIASLCNEWGYCARRTKRYDETRQMYQIAWDVLPNHVQISIATEI